MTRTNPRQDVGREPAHRVDIGAVIHLAGEDRERPLAHPDPIQQKRRIEPRCVDAISDRAHLVRSEEHTSELQSLMRISYAVFCLKKKKKQKTIRELNSNTQN